MPTTNEELLYSEIVRIAGQNEDFAADVIERPDSKKALCVDAITPLNSKFRVIFKDTPLVLTTTYQTVFSNNGEGLLIGFVCDTTSNTALAFELIIDGETIFTELTMDFISNMYGTNYGENIYLYLGRYDLGDLQFRPPNPIKVSSNVTLKARRTTATAKTVNRSLYMWNGV